MQLAEPMQLATVEVQETVGKGSVEVAKGAAKRAAVGEPADCPQARPGGSWVVAAPEVAAAVAAARVEVEREEAARAVAATGAVKAAMVVASARRASRRF